MLTGDHGLATSASPDTISVPPITGSRAGSVVSVGSVVSAPSVEAVSPASSGGVVASVAAVVPSDGVVVSPPPLTESSSLLRSEQAAAISPRLSATAATLVHLFRFDDRA